MSTWLRKIFQIGTYSLWFLSNQFLQNSWNLPKKTGTGDLSFRAHAKFPEKLLFLPPDTHEEVRNLKFFRKILRTYQITDSWSKYTLNRTLILTSAVMLCAIWHHLYNLKDVKNTHGGVLLLASFIYGCFFTFVKKKKKRYPIAQSISSYP